MLCILSSFIKRIFILTSHLLRPSHHKYRDRWTDHTTGGWLPRCPRAPKFLHYQSAPMCPCCQSALQCTLLAGPLQCPLPASALMCPLPTNALKCQLLPSALQCPLLAGPLQCPLPASALMCPLPTNALKCQLLPSALQCPLLAGPLQCPLLAGPLQCPLLAGPLQCPLLAGPLQCPLLAGPLRCPLLAGPLQCPLIAGPLRCPLLAGPLRCPLLAGLLQCPLPMSALKCQLLPSAHQSPLLPCHPRCCGFPQENLGGGGYMSVAGPKAKATETLGPPRSPEPPASPWRTPVSPSWTRLQGAHPPPRWICYGAGCAYWEGGIMPGFWTHCSLFFPCPSWVSLFGYFPVLVKLIDLFLAPVLVLIDYFPCVYSPEFPLSLGPFTCLLCCVSWVPLLKEDLFLTELRDCPLLLWVVY